MPNIQVQLRRGTTTEHSSFAGAEGEVTVDTTLNTLMVHTGGAAGSGVRLAKHSELGGLADGSVTTAKLAAGAVTPAKTDFDQLTIEAESSEGQGQTGIAALEMVGANGALIDLSQDPESDYDARLINQAQQTSLISKDPVLIQTKTGTTTNTALNIHTDGKVQVGSNSTPAYALDVDGDVNVTGDFKVNGTNLAPTVADNSVTFTKMQDINTAKVIGRTSVGNGNPEEVSILDDDTMATASATSLATSESIKAYVDAQTGGISKWSSGWVTQDNQGSPTSLANQATLTFTHNLGTADVNVCVYVAGSSAGAGANQVFFSESGTARYGAVAKNMQSNSVGIQLANNGVHIVSSTGLSTTPSWGDIYATHIKVVVTG